MATYGIGGTEVKQDASEAFSDIDQNRTIMVEKLTKDAPIKPQFVEGLTNIEAVFENFAPETDVEFVDSEGASKKESLSFSNLGDFGVKGITAQSDFLKDLTAQKEQNHKMIKQLKTNKILRQAIDNEESRIELINAMNALIKDLDQK